MAEIKEKFCADCKYEDIMSSEYPCNECCNAYTSKFEGKTNFDIIKEMSVGELAEFIASIHCHGKNAQVFFNEKWMSKTEYKKQIGKWLEREVGNDG